MVSLLEQDDGPLLRVCAKPGGAVTVEADEVAPSRAACRTLLGYILAQAYYDGMTAVKLRVSQATTTVQMFYVGPDESGLITQWEMKPPPPNAYAGLLQALLEACTLQPGIEGRGTLRLQVNDERVNVSINMVSWHEVNLEWHRRPHAKA